MKFNTQSTTLLCLTILLVALTYSPGSGQNHPVNDGPHVRWDTDDSVTVLYVCESELLEKRFVQADTIEFTGLCHDSLTEYVIPAAPHPTDPYVFEKPSRMIALSDIHGEYDYLVSSLIGFGVIDSDLKWSYGNGHLVIVGDVYDRGDQVTECLWLIYRLEQEALRASGRVHFTIGNHEHMAICGDLRYIHKNYSKVVEPLLEMTYNEMYGDNMELGRWMRSKNTLLKIGDILFIHAGVNRAIMQSGFSMQELNHMIRSNLHIPKDSVRSDSLLSMLYRGSGPLWYRGFSSNKPHERDSSAYVDRVLSRFEAECIVVGHSEKDVIQTYYEDRVILLDIPVRSYRGFQAVEWRDNKIFRVWPDGRREPVN